ncbi:hypothetical protein PSH58_06735 [Pseudomonas hefeiensis]|uniref:Hemagglutinin n=1 Tax=Pseudomonas hefeiensis TaxID=2738125 RepID=A0ABY9GES1_9PSED|nr:MULTISPECIES: hypothetical protein [unclassified Pseudomonas]WLH14027.1 hypothetical protein PSH57_06730 [Pseudomonas sp. FP205]WLH97081.1 hypothetical protein PSH58_06735 [Pseudomonas sp. FP53]WLI41357.1 hypothetical protein PSH74_06720 [Pseudomonas sp. FP821]
MFPNKSVPFSPSTDLPKNENEFGATMPIAISASDDASSVTRSGISGGTIVISNDAEQQKRTGKNGEQTVASLNRDVSSDRDTSGVLKPIFDEDEIRAGFEIVGAFANEASTLLANKAKEVDLKRKQAEAAEAKALDPNAQLTDTERLALINSSQQLKAQARNIADNWGAGGTYRQITTALVGAASGNISGSNGAFVQGLVVNYVQQRGAGYIGDLVADGKLTEGSPLHAALHGIVACAGAAASSQSCGSGAAGAAASSLLTGLFSEASPDESESQREAKRNLIVSIVTGLAANSSSLDPATANSAAGAAVDNNWLATQQLVQAEKEYSEADGLGAKAQVIAKWAYIHKKQDVLTRFGVGKGLVQAGWSDVEGLAQFLLHPVDGINGLKALVNDPEARKQFGDGVVNELNAKLDRVKDALENGGDDRAVQLGQDIGELVWQVGSIATGVGGAAKGGVALAKAGIKVGTEGLEAMAGLAKFDKLVARGGQFNPNGTPLMDFRALTNAQKSIIGDVMGGERIKSLVPSAEKIGRAPDIGQTGIDDLYKVDKPGVDYLVVEYKFGSSKLKPTKDGLQMSDDWLQGTNTNYDRILESVGGNQKTADSINKAMAAGRVEKWLVHTDPFGNVTVGVLEKGGKFVTDPVATSKLLGGIQ